MKKVKTFESFLNEFGPLAGSGNTSANDLDKAKRKAAKKSERGEMVYVVSGKYGTYKLSKYHIEGDTYAAFYNGMEQELDESAVTEGQADVNKSYDKVIELIRKEARRLNDDDAYEFHERLKEFFNKTI